jgi:hypothetical protein
MPISGCSWRVIRSSNGGVWIAADVEGNTRLASFINRVTAQHVEMDQAAAAADLPSRLWADLSAIRFNTWLADNISYSMVPPSLLVILFQG